MSCPRCAHGAKEGWWGPPHDLTHCHKCHRDWRLGSPQCHCTLCCAHFSNHRAADLHLTATRCRPPGEVFAKSGLTRLAHCRDRYGLIWRLAGTNPWAESTAKVPRAPQQSATQPLEASAGTAGTREPFSALD
jgi:phenylpropionate dioxygenase-like ring-hydroxylating dioxygenase large terminal subunit